MKSLIRVLKNERYSTLLMLLLLIFNSAVFFNVSAAIKYTPSAGACNFLCVSDKSMTQINTSMLSGGVGSAINQPLNTGLIADESYSVKYARCVEQFGADKCKPSYTSLATVAALGTSGSSFNSVDALSNLNVTILAERPASAVDYVQDKVYALTHFNSVAAQAADDPTTVGGREAYYSPGGVGFSLLKPIQNFWSWSVRVVYGFMLIIVIIIAFAIMFRQRLSGNVEVTVQSAIPAIALAMILVPLSYAISGLFIDFITVGTNAVHEFLIGAPGSPGNSIYLHSADAVNLKDPLNPATPYTDRGYFPDDVRVDWLRARDKINVSTTFGEAAKDVGQASGLNGNVIFLAVGSIVNALTGKGQDADPADFTWIGDIVQFFISIVTLWIGVQIFVHLFKKYMVLILYPVISPFIFATIAIPGNGSKSIMQYVKVMMAAALAFIVTYGMFLLSIIFTSSDFLKDVPSFASGSFNPPLIGLKSLGVGSNEMTQLLLTLIGLGIYFSIPNTLKSIDESLGAQDAIPKFIKTPIDSFRESQRVMFKTAPALAGRVAGTGARLAGATGAAPFRAFSGARDLADRARGIDPEKDYRSYRNRQRAARQTRNDNAKARTADWRASSNILKRAAAGAVGAVDMAQNNLAGQIEGTGSSLPGDVQRPKVEVTGNEITISRQEISTLLSANGILLQGKTINYTGYSTRGTPVILGIGTVEFKVTGPAVTLSYPPKLLFGTLVAKVSARPDVKTYDKDMSPADRDANLAKLKFKDYTGADSGVKTVPITVPGIPTPIIYTPAQALRIELDGDPRAAGTDTVKQDFKVVTNDLQEVFGNTKEQNGLFTPTDITAILRPGVTFKAWDDMAVRVNGKEEFTTTAPFNIKFTLR